MDFKRIQIVLIISFILFDAYLLLMLFSRVEKRPIVTDTASEISIEQELTERGVQFNEFEDIQRDMPFVVAKTNNYLAENLSQLEDQEVSVSSDGVLTSTFDEPVDLNIEINNETTGLSEEDRKMITNNYLSDPNMFIGGEHYRSFWYVNTNRTIYIRMTAVDDLPIVDGSAEIQINLNEDYKMIGYSQTFQADITTLKTETQTISEREAIEIIDRRAETIIPDKAIIHYSILVYYRSSNLENFSIYSPAWEIIYDDIESGRYILLIDATNGKLINRYQMTSFNKDN